MGIIGSILIVLVFGDLLWWWRADRVLRRFPRTQGWRVALGIFMAAQFIGLSLVVISRGFGVNVGGLLTHQWLTVIYLWHCLVLFPMLLLWIPYTIARGLVLGVRRVLDRRASRQQATRAQESGRSITRREFARVLGTAAPAIVTLGAAGVALWQIERFRIRRQTIHLATLPPTLDGLTIAHVTDLHVGQFTRGDVLDRIIRATNDLHADLVLYTGDLINFALSDLDAALAVVGQMRATHGFYMCEGNHDLFEDADEFRRRTRAAGLNLLVNESTVLSIRGTPVQLLGLRWGARDGHPHDPASRGDHAIAASMQELLPQRALGAFPILLAHHPHAFDFAAEIPLTLAGHTHGGQLMATPHVGFGPMLYRYWSGLYETANRALFVSNGTGNWFPLRTRAPAEIVHITLRRS